MVTAALPAQSQPTYDPQRIERIVDQVFPCTAEAEFIKSVHARDAWKLRSWRTRDDESGKRVELFSEAEAFIRRCFLAKSQYYADCAALLKRNLLTEGFDAHWNIRIPADEQLASQHEEQPLPDWDDFDLDTDAFPVIDDETFSQYLDPTLLCLPDDLHSGPSLDGSMMEQTMDFEHTPTSGGLIVECASMDVDFAANPAPLSPSAATGYQNDVLGLAMDCDQHGLPIDFLE